ncbi:vitamin K epoxide reductase family protein [Chloroflexota bacterium]
MKRYRSLAAILLLVSIFISPVTAYAQSNPPVVRAVLFYSPTCPHCHTVINETILPMIEKYGNQLQIISIDVSQPQGQTFFLSAMQMFGLESAGVPFLVIDDIYLIGSIDIPEKFPGLVEKYLSEGGVDFPDIPKLREAIFQAMQEDALTVTAAAPSTTLQTTPTPDSVSQSPISPTATPGIIGLQTETSNWRDTFSRDPFGNTLSVIVLIGMIGAIIWTVVFFKKKNETTPKGNTPAWIVPLLCVIGFGVAGYLAYVETTQVSAVCGPVGDCNTVQQSKYASLFGILPIGIVGLVGYVTILAAWLVTRYAKNPLSDYAVLFIFITTAFGTLFSIYLTFLEPFVIGATCIWCLSSALLMTVLMLLSARPAKTALSKLRRP